MDIDCPNNQIKESVDRLMAACGDPRDCLKVLIDSGIIDRSVYFPYLSPRRICLPDEEGLVAELDELTRQVSGQLDLVDLMETSPCTNLS